MVSFEFQPVNTFRHMWFLEKSHQKHASFLFEFNTVQIWPNFDQSSAVYISITQQCSWQSFSPHSCHEHPCQCTVHIRGLTWVKPFFLTSKKPGLDLSKPVRQSNSSVPCNIGISSCRQNHCSSTSLHQLVYIKFSWKSFVCHPMLSCSRLSLQLLRALCSALVQLVSMEC